MKNLTVTIENLSAEGGVFTTPVWVGFHGGSFDLFNVGEVASTEVERFAEDGNFTPLVNAFSGEQGVITGPNGVDGPLDPGEAVSMVFNVDSNSGRFLSYGTMVLPSNDAFLGNEVPDFWEIFNIAGEYTGDRSVIVSGDQVWDAGTEINSETNAAFLDQIAPNTGDEENGVFINHPGFNGSVGNPDASPMNILGGTTAAGNLIDPITADFTLPNHDLLKITVAENREVFGTRDDDMLEGGIGADLLSGDRGHDVLRGGGGNDTLLGGRGNDLLIANGNQHYTADLITLNDSGVTGSAELMLDGANLTVHITGSGLESNMPHPQHIHGLENGGDSQTPTAENDTDGDGFIELAEGLPTYGPILLSLTSPQGAGLEGFPSTPESTLDFTESYSFDLTDPQMQSDFAALLPLVNREIVLHGQTLTESDGADTEGEADGTAGYKAVLPVAAGEIEAVGEGVIGNALLDGGRDNDILIGSNGHDMLLGGRGDDVAFGGSGDDLLNGGRNHDSLYGGNGNDILIGEQGDDHLSGGMGSDIFVFGRHADHDIITDFTMNDIVKLDGMFDSAQEALDAITFEDGNAYLKSHSDSITFMGVDVSAFSLSSFEIV